MSTSRPKPPASFPAVGDRVQHEQYGVGSVTLLDVYHTVIDFDAHGKRTFVSPRVVLAESSVPAPEKPTRKKAVARKKKE